MSLSARLSTYDYPEARRVVYGEGATFVPVCPACGRFVKAHDTITFDGMGQPVGPNARCAHCGPVQMLWEGYV